MMGRTCRLRPNDCFSHCSVASAKESSDFDVIGAAVGFECRPTLGFVSAHAACTNFYSEPKSQQTFLNAAFSAIKFPGLGPILRQLIDLRPYLLGCHDKATDIS